MIYFFSVFHIELFSLILNIFYIKYLPILYFKKYNLYSLKIGNNKFNFINHCYYYSLFYILYTPNSLTSSFALNYFETK